MLYLNPPFHIINGISLFPDHADPLQYYYLPIAPRLTERPDPASGLPVPQIQVLKFRGGAGSGGFLNFDVNIGLDPGALDDIRAELTRLARLRSAPRLAPVPLVDGTVKMMLFDRQTGDPAPDGTATQRFVLKINQHAKPSLYGDNQAAFSVQLTQDGVVALDKALRGELSPIGIVYSLDFLGLRPAYSVRLNVDWDRVQKHLDESFGVDSIFVTAQIETAVDELIDQRAIDLQVDTFVPEGEDTEGVLGRRDQAVEEVRDMITQAFFEPSLDPVKEEEDGWDKAEHLAKTVSALAVTGGWAGIGSFTYKKTDYTRIDRKVLNVHMSERTTVKRSIYPQGHLSGLFRTLREPGMSADRFILEVDLNDPWFERRKVMVISRGNFEEDSIGSINVTLTYAGEPQNIVLESSADRKELSWGSRLLGGAMELPVATRYTVNFKGVDGTERPLSLESATGTIETDILEIQPRELYGVVPIPVIALNFPWDRYTHVEVQAHYLDEENGIRVDDNFLLQSDRPEATWKLFLRDPTRTQFQYKLIYHAVNHKDVEGPWTESSEERIIIRDPFPQKRTLEVVPALVWTEVERAFVDLEYEDPANQILQEASFEFTETRRDTQKFTVDLADPNRRLIAYQVMVLFKDGRQMEVPRSFTLERRITVRGDMRGHRIVPVLPEAVDFEIKKVKEMRVDTRYEDAPAGLSFADTFRFRSAADRATFEFDYVDDQKSDFEYRVTYLFTNGMARSTSWERAEVEELRVPVG